MESHGIRGILSDARDIAQVTREKVVAPKSAENEMSLWERTSNRAVGTIGVLAALAAVGYIYHGQTEQIESSLAGDAGRQIQNFDVIPSQHLSTNPFRKSISFEVSRTDGSTCTATYTTKGNTGVKPARWLYRDRADIISLGDCKPVVAATIPTAPKKK